MTDDWLDLPGLEPDLEADAEYDLHDELGGHPLEAVPDLLEEAPDPPIADDLALDTPQQHDLDEAAVARDALVDVYGVSADDLSAVADRLGLPPDLDSLSAAVVLGELGLDASAQHGDLDGLAVAVSAGQEVLVNGALGPLAVLAVGAESVELQDSAGVLTQVPIREFEDAWAQASYAMVVAEPVAAAAEVVLSTGPVTVLGMSWPQAT